MADDVNPSSPNTCCTQWIKRSQKLERSRDALRQSVKILEGQIERQSIETASLKEEVERQSEQQKAERFKMASINKELEKHIQDMKANISFVESTRSLKNFDEDEIGMLKARILTSQKEIKSLKELLEKEARKNDYERKKSELEKKKATEAWKLLKDEKKKGEEHKCLFVSEKKISEDLRISLEKFKVEANELREKLNAEIAKAQDEKRQIEAKKLKAYGEKTHTDSEKANADEQKRLIEEERKKNADLKKHANQLRRNLEEERRKREEVQKKFDDIYAISIFGDKDRNVFKTLKDTELKLLKERLKLERKRVKHAERVAKQEKSEKKVIVQEVHLLKQNFMQVFYRLNMLDGLLSHNMGSTNAVQKIMNYPDLTFFKLNDLLRPKKDDFDQQTDLGPSQIRYGGPRTRTEPIGECIGLPVSRGCCSTPKTGINSGLESPVGGSLRNKSQSSAACSTCIHFSDSKLMGSQGSDSVVENSTAKFEAKSILNVPDSSGAVAQNAMHGSCQVGVKDIDRNNGLKGVEKHSSKSSSYKAAAQVKDGNSKKRKFDNDVESVAYLHSRDSKSHLIFGDKVPIVNNQVRNLDQFSLPNSSKRSTVFKDFDYKKAPLKEGQTNLCKHNFDTNCQIKKSTVKCANKKKAGKSMYKYKNDHCPVQEAEPDPSEFVINHSVISLGNKQAFLKRIETLRKSGGCLKLLDLDNYSDEVRFRNAMKCPLSPSLPEIKIPNFQLDGIDDSHALMAKDIPVPGLSDNSYAQHDVLYDITKNASQGDDNQSLVFERIYHARKPEIELGRFPFLKETCAGHQGHCLEYSAEQNMIELEVIPLSKAGNSTFSMGYKKSQPSPDAIGESSLQSHSQLFHDGSCTGGSTLGNNLFNAEKVAEHDIQQLFESDSISKIPHPSFSSQENSPFKSTDETDTGQKLYYFTSFSNSRNVDCMFRIISVLKAFTSQDLMVSEIDQLLVEVLSGLLFEELQSEEKVAVFFSFLLGSISARMSEHCKNIVEGGSFQFLESFSREISRVVSTGKVKFFLDQMFYLDILFRLMESFLIEREVLVIGDAKQHPSSFSSFLGSRFHIDFESICVLSTDVTVSQFIAGCSIFSSICIATDDIGFLLALSYKMLRICHDDITSVLRALHVFANICGKWFFNPGNYRFLVTTISSVVTLLEGRVNSVSDHLPHNLNLAPRLVTDFSPCKQCPFATNAICMDKLIFYLLDVLEDYSLPRNDYPNTNNYYITSNRLVPTGATGEKTSIGIKSKFGVQCDASCSIFKYVKVTGNQSDMFSETVFCDFTDIISLVELLDHYMGWDWTYKEAMPRLLKMVQLCACENISAALFILVGNLGRHGCSSGGYQKAGIIELRCKLTELLGSLIARKTSFSTQVAAIGALLNLLPMKFVDILDEHHDITLESCESPYIEHIQQWFSQLSENQQVAVKNIFDNEDESRR